MRGLPSLALVAAAAPRRERRMRRHSWAASDYASFAIAEAAVDAVGARGVDVVADAESIKKVQTAKRVHARVALVPLFALYPSCLALCALAPLSAL